jgi:transcriptional regulator with XRE-family HTH domain
MGRRVRSARVDAGLSQRELAALCAEHGAPIGYAKIQYIEAENHRGGTTGPTLRALALALRVSADWLICITDEKTPRKST